MEQNAFTLLLSSILAGIATILTIIGVSTNGWPGRQQLFAYHTSNLTAAGVLLIISIFFLAISIVFMLMFWRGMISNASDKVKSVVLVFLIIASIFIVIAYSRPASKEFFSYHLSVSGGILAFLSAIIFTYWLGRTSVTFLH
ncbi:hypothetical protein I4U23_008384 [Adineta vaga]|nr:hypothetical protein I4U23_008384 [Adineta vaga]